MRNFLLVLNLETLINKNAILKIEHQSKDHLLSQTSANDSLEYPHDKLDSNNDDSHSWTNVTKLYPFLPDAFYHQND